MNISELYTAISKAENDIAKYNTLISKSSNSKAKLGDSKDKLAQSLDLLKNGLIIDGVTAGEGEITAGISSIERSIGNMDAVIMQAQLEIKKLEGDIAGYREQIAKLIEYERIAREEAARRQAEKSRETYNRKLKMQEER